MIDFPALVQGLLIVLVIALIIAAILFFRKPALRKALSQDKRALLLLVTLGGISVVTIIVGVKVAHWTTSYRQAKSDLLLSQELNLDEYRFVDQSFKPLGQEYRQLKHSSHEIDKIISKVNQLLPRHQNHKHLLETLLKSFQGKKDEQKTLYKAVNIQIRNAMLLSATTQDTLSVHNQFYNRAKILHASIVASREDVQKRLGDAAGLFVDSLKEAKKRLLRSEKNQKTAKAQRKARQKGKKQKRKDKQKAVIFYHFPDATAQTLLLHLKQYDAESLVTTQKIIQQIISARQNKDTMDVLSQREVDLQIPLKKTMQLWSDAEQQGQQYWGNILYSLEAAYLADRFDMPHHNRAYRTLMRDLKQKIPIYLDILVQTHKDAKNSYYAPAFMEKAVKVKK